MLAAGIESPVPLDDLESHLREEVKQQMRGGSSVEEAFETAARRLGPARELQGEFARLGELRENRERRQILFGLGLSAVAYLSPLVLAIPKPWIHMNPTERWFGLAAVTLTVLTLFSGFLLYRFLPVIPDKRVRSRIQFACFLPVLVWVGVFAYLILPRVDFTVGLLTGVIMWALYPLAIPVGLVVGLDEAARRKAPPLIRDT